MSVSLYVCVCVSVIHFYIIAFILKLHVRLYIITKLLFFILLFYFISVINLIVVIDRISEGNNAITSVHPSVCFHSILGTNWLLTLNFCTSIVHDHSSQEIEGQGQDHKSG